MTREKAKGIFTIYTDGQDKFIKVDKRQFDNFIDLIYDSFEGLQNRSCKKCKYVSIDTLGLIYCASPKSPLSSCLFAIHPNFSCNKWESK